MLAFRVMKESKKYRKPHFCEIYNQAQRAGNKSACGFRMDKKSKKQKRNLNANSKSTDSETT